MKRIICIGNRNGERDDVGPHVFDRLMRGARPTDVEIIDGGPAGLDLLHYTDGAECVVFVDAFPTGEDDRGVTVWTADCVAVATPSDGAGGLALLLRGMPSARERKAPIVWVVGVSGTPEDWKIEDAADWALHLARTGRALRLYRRRNLTVTA